MTSNNDKNGHFFVEEKFGAAEQSISWSIKFKTTKEAP